ncbi:MAG: DNA polymerase III subunit delta [Bacteroidota bacterium]|nr:DNA polymerase III subunit delta [Bacteroidota bacterium]
MNYSKIIKSLQDKKIEPIYFLTGEETFYIDKISTYIANNILNEDEKQFNQTILYGKEITIEDVILEAKLFPSFGEKRVVIVKEAQHLRNIDKLEDYIKTPQKSTILVICYKGKYLDKRKKISKLINQKCVLLESKKLYDTQIVKWIEDFIIQNGYSINQKSCQMLNEALGNNLSNIYNELKKLLALPIKDKKITDNIIEKYVGLSKDFNAFELQDALSQKNVYKSYYITKHLLLNQKTNPIEKIIGLLFSFFQKVVTLHSLQDKSKNNIASVLKINPFFITQYVEAAKKYTTKELYHIITLLKNYDLRAKGVNNKNTTKASLIRELISRILHAEK